MKTYEIGFPGQDDPIWIKTDCKVILLDDSEQVEYVKEIDIDSRMPGVDIVIESNKSHEPELIEALKWARAYLIELQADPDVDVIDEAIQMATDYKDTDNGNFDAPMVVEFNTVESTKSETGPFKCALCDGVLKYYDGALGYESMICDSCGVDVNDLRVCKRGDKFVINNINRK